MKNLIAVLLVCFAIFAFISCKKGNEVTMSSSGKPTILGLWHFVSDTDVTTSGLLYGGGTTAYKILPGDYYNFDANGVLYINEQNAGGRDTVNYTILSDSTINVYYLKNNIQVPYGDGIFNIRTLTANNLTIFCRLSDLPPFLSYDTMHFKR